MLEDYPDILTVKEVREILYIGKNKAYQLLESGAIKGVKVGRDWRIRKRDLIVHFEDPYGTSIQQRIP